MALGPDGEKRRRKVVVSCRIVAVDFLGKFIFLTEIKPKAKKPRDNPVKRFNDFAKSGDFSGALDVAAVRRKLSETETKLAEFIASKSIAGWVWEEVVMKKTHPALNIDHLMAAVRYSQITGREVQKMFFNAINDFDGEKILEIANALWFFKKQTEKFSDGRFYDWQRARLLIAKAYLESNGEKWKRRQIAEYLFGKGVKNDDINWRSLIRACRGMNFPLDEKRHPRKK